MNFGQMKTRVRRRVNEPSTAFFTDADIEDALNEGYHELADATEFYEREALVPMIKGHTYYDLTNILPDTFLSPRRAFNPTTNRWLAPTDPINQDIHTFVQWELVQGEPESYLMRGNWWLGVFPKPSQDGAGMRLNYTGIPAAMVEDTDEPEAIPEEFHDAIVEYAVYDLLGQKRQGNKALIHWGAYLALEDKLRRYVDGRTSLARVNSL